MGLGARFTVQHQAERGDAGTELGGPGARAALQPKR